MDNQKIGRFIADMRRQNGITQKNLAERLNVTDKAVSKWERGLSYPDITILPALAKELGISVGELLNGETSASAEESEKVVVDTALDYAEKALKSGINSFRNIFALVFSLTLAAGIAVCAIVDLAVSHRFTWSLYPIASIVFSWLVIYPTANFGKKGITGSLIALSTAILPFLWILGILSGAPVFRIGAPCAVIALAYLWIVFAVGKLLRKRKLIAAAIGFVMAIPFHFIINEAVAKLIHEPRDSTWDMLTYSIFVVIAAILFVVGRFKK